MYNTVTLIYVGFPNTAANLAILLQFNVKYSTTCNIPYVVDWLMDSIGQSGYSSVFLVHSAVANGYFGNCVGNHCSTLSF